MARFHFLALLSVASSLFSQTTASPLQKRTLSRVNEPGLMGTGTYPRATSLQDGSILGCFTAFSNGNTILTTVSSTNGGYDWNVIGSIATAVTATTDLDNCFVHQLPSGRVLAAFRNHDRETVNGPYTYYRITICYSDDNGVTWEYLSTAASSPTPGLGLWEPFMMDALDGSLMLYYSYETATDGSDQNSILVRSTTGGASFTAPQTISGADITSRDGMLGVVRLGTGSETLIAVFESLDPDTGITSITSPDDGVTWENRQIVYKSSVAGATNQAPQIAYVGTTLVVSFMTTEDDVDAAANVKAVASTNGGASWGEKVTVLDACNWAGELVLSSTTWIIMCESGGAALAQMMLLS